MLTCNQYSGLRAEHHCQKHSPDGIARTSDLAAQLEVKGPSITARVQELASAGLVHYSLRNRATLTVEGNRQAQKGV